MDEGEKMTVDGAPLPARLVDADMTLKTSDKIVLVLSRILVHYTTRFEDLHRDLAIKMLTRIQPWIAELREGPYQIPDDKARKAFSTTVDQKSHQIMEVIRLVRARDELSEEVMRRRQRENYHFNRPSYCEELMTQPWQQFLHPQAPGWPEEITNLPRVTSHQVIPNGGMRLLLKWEEEVKETYAFLDANRPGPSRFKSGLRAMAADPIIGRTKNGDIKTVTLRRMPNSPFTPLRRDLSEYDEGDFSLANKVLARLEGHRVLDNNFLIADVKDWKRGPLSDKEEGTDKDTGQSSDEVQG